MTRRLSGIHAAWHFWYAVSFGGESGLRKLGLCGTHPLTQRYVLSIKGDIEYELIVKCTN
ncbi:DUF3265 domain-containing protein [Vibrio vulnificus]|uniref:DUF3265 domain-containing protein n=1 Tax=Vibrio vulnificus TaxID=672 RepID=A0ABX4WVW2_VIBVL|nr:DUF3265 domain-containing protein [Vibrio vulnificus]EGR0054918.1 DUF3265 domain-containing protein [Vibrio vulnificus]PNM67517.1 DUF3265 domain-containing protein [Vibrio vulnificus]POB92782.1 DUF3265 domain-containing protein [Vibrio vulnificus]